MSHCFPLMIQAHFKPTHLNYFCHVNIEINSLDRIGCKCKEDVLKNKIYSVVLI